MGFLYLRVEKVREGVPVDVGTKLVLLADEVLMGRSEEVDLTLRDMRVSRRHARISREGDEVWLENLSRFGTFLNGSGVEGRVRLEPADWIQIGGVLLRVLEQTDETVPVSHIMTFDQPPASFVETGECSLELLRNDQALLFGCPVTLRPAPFLALRSLADCAGQWVSFDTLAQAIWRDDWTLYVGYANKYISYVRKGLLETLESNPELVDQVRAAIRSNADEYTELDGLEEMEIDRLLREFIKARKKIGYRLHLSPATVRIR